MTKNLPYNRAERVSVQIYQIISKACIIDLFDPRVKELEITRVSMTKDLRLARVYFYLRNNSARNIGKARQGLKSAKGYFKKIIKEELSLKNIPDFQFFYDEALELEHKIESVMTEGTLKNGSL